MLGLSNFNNKKYIGPQISLGFLQFLFGNDSNQAEED